MTTILADPKKSGGINTWNNQYIRLAPNATIIYSVEELQRTIYNLGENNTKQCLLINNYTNMDFYNNEVLLNIVKYFDVFFVIHTDLCPTNKIFVDFVDYFKGSICTCWSAYQKFQKLYPNKESIYVPNTVPKNKFYLKTFKRHIRCHYVGRLTPEKNIPMLLEAIKLLAHDNIILYIYGGNNDNYMKYLAEFTKYLGIENNVVFIEKTESKEELYKDADFVILPSVHEGLPYCLLEAVSYGVPIISHNVSNIDYHIHGEIYYKYDGINMDDFKNDLYIDDYGILLKKIGYLELMVTPKILTQKGIAHILAPLCMNDNKLVMGKKIMVPPILLNVKNETYLNNVNKICNMINILVCST